MKTIEYPIKELVRFEMDGNKIWRLRYERLHPLIPFDRNRYEKTDKEYEDFILQTHKFCEKQNFSLEGDGYVFTLHWNRGKPNLGFPNDGLPTLLFPYCRKDFTRGFWVCHPPPYYGNPHYKKYIEDNNGECPLPFPKDMKWWEV
jgi:hypothetical protein